jgi:hypothetical protein
MFYVLRTFPGSLTILELVKQSIFVKFRGNNKVKTPELVIMSA